MRNVVAMLLVAACASAASAQTIGLFADSLGTDCNLIIPFPSEPVRVFAVATLEGDAADGIQFAAFRVQGLPAGWTATLALGPGANVVVGNLFVEGVGVGFPSCTHNTRQVLLTARITPTSDVQNVHLQVLPHSIAGDRCSIKDSCEIQTPLFCTCADIFIECVPAEGLPSQINGQGCVVQTTNDSWSRVKRLYE